MLIKNIHVMETVQDYIEETLILWRQESELLMNLDKKANVFLAFVSAKKLGYSHFVWDNMSTGSFIEYQPKDFGKTDMCAHVKTFRHSYSNTNFLYPWILCKCEKNTFIPKKYFSNEYTGLTFDKYIRSLFRNLGIWWTFHFVNKNPVHRKNWWN